MYRYLSFLALILLGFGFGPAAAQQYDAPIPEEFRAKRLPRQKLSGPRFGLTFFTGETLDQRQHGELGATMSQFGWQFETQVVSTTGGNQALMEWLILLGGLERSENNVSAAWITGYRLANGIELGVGPSLSMNLSQDITNSSMVVAGGATLPFGDLYLPLNLAVAFSDGGPRITTLMGWIVG